jgi:hypothetical protein
MTEENLVTISVEQREREVIITRVFDAPREFVFNTCNIRI